MSGFFDNVEMGPSDPILGVAQAYRVCFVIDLIQLNIVPQLILTILPFILLFFDLVDSLHGLLFRLIPLLSK